MIGIHGSRRMAISEPVLQQIVAGVRASKRRVGYLGSEAALTILNNNDPLPPSWSAHWDTGALIVQANNVTIDHYQINGTVVFSGDNPIMTNCRVRATAGAFFGVTLSGSSHGVLTITDTTVIGDATSGTAQSDGISSDSGLVAQRCDVSNTGDGIHIVAQADPADALISQCYVHDLAFVNEAQHCDGIQVFNNSVDPSFFTVEHCYVGRSLSTLGTPINAALTCGTSTNDTALPLATATINNNYFQSGLYHLRLNYRLHNATVINNDFGALHASEFGIVDSVVPVAAWSGNNDVSGTPISNPHVLTAPTVKESLQTTDGLVSSQVLSTTGATTAAGDTLLVVYLTDNNTASAPTSTAGTLTQFGTTVTNGNGDGILRVYTARVATSGSKDVTIPAAGGFDVMAAVLVLSGDVEIEGYVSQSISSSNTSFATPTTSVAGEKDLILAAIMNTQGATFDLSGSGLTTQANPKCPPYAALAVGSVTLSSSGAVPAYPFTSSTLVKPGIMVFGLQRLV